MDRVKVKRLLKKLDKTIRELTEETEIEHISIYLIGDAVSIDDYTNITKPKFSYYHKNDMEHITIDGIFFGG